MVLSGDGSLLQLLHRNKASQFMKSIYYHLLWYTALLGRMWGQSGGCDHTLQWKVLKFREIKWLSKSTQWWMPAPSQILLPLVFCRWGLEALEKKTQPKKNSNPPSIICLYISISDPRYKFLLRQSPSERPQDSNSVHPPQILHMDNHVTTAFSMSFCWVTSGLFGFQVGSELRIFYTKSYMMAPPISFPSTDQVWMRS